MEFWSDTHHSTTAVLEPTGCDGINVYYYRILLTVTDPQGLATTQEVRLFPDCGPNTPPTISNIPDQTIFQNSSTGPIPFTIGDAETPPANLQLSSVSSNLGLIPNQNIVFGGFDADRTVTVTPVAGQTGTATITVTVNDGPNNTSTSFRDHGQCGFTYTYADSYELHQRQHRRLRLRLRRDRLQPVSGP